MAVGRTEVWSAPAGETLTAVIPAHNRVRHCIALVHFLRANGFAHPIVVADSSRPDRGNAIREAVRGMATYHAFEPQLKQYEKFARIARLVETPYLVLLPDDDILFPHAIEASLAHLEDHPDHVAAHGYSLRFGLGLGDFDIYQVEHFIPTIADAEPLQRYYRLMRRYQPHIWAVFRTEIYALAMSAAAAITGTVFQEFLFQIASVLQGKVARLPLIYAMRGMEISEAPYTESDPLQWFVHDAASFFAGYAPFRAAVLNFLRHGEVGSRKGIKQLLAPAPVKRGVVIDLPNRIPLEQLVDLISTTYLAQAVDLGPVNYQVRYGLGELDTPVAFPGPWPGFRAVEPRDVVRASRLPDRRYIWRRDVVEAEPAEEIRITPEEMARVEQQLDAYELEGERIDRNAAATWLIS